MTKLLVRAAFAGSLIFAAVAALGASPAIAQDKPHLSKDVLKPLGEAQQLMQKGDNDGALAKIKEAQAVTDQTDEDTYYINKFLASVAINLKDMATATTAYEAMVASPAEPEDDKKGNLHNALLLSSNVQHWQQVINDAKQLEPLNGMDAATYASLAVAEYNSQNETAAAAAAQKSIDLSKAANEPPNANAQIIVANVQAKTDPKAAEKTWEAMVVNDPSDAETWHNLTALAFGAGVVKNVDALFYCRLDFVVGAMRSADDYTTCASLANVEKDYEEARTILEDGLKTGKLSPGQASMLSQVRSKAEQDSHIIDEAIKGARTGEQHLDLAEDLFGYGRYEDSVSEAQKAIAKGGLKDPGEAQLILGVSQAGAGQFDAAIQTLSTVGNTHQTAAHLWTLYAQARIKQAGANAPAGNPAGN